MSEIEIISTNTLSDKKYPLKEIKFQKPGHGGRPVEHLHEIYYRPDAVAVLLVGKQIVANDAVQSRILHEW